MKLVPISANGLWLAMSNPYHRINPCTWGNKWRDLWVTILLFTPYNPLLLLTYNSLVDSCLRSPS